MSSPLWMLSFQFQGPLIAIAVALALLFRGNLNKLLTAWSFFTRRHDFIKSNFEKSGRNMFSFNILHHSVTVVRGMEARRAYFDDKSLNFLEGYKILMGAAPMLSDIKKELPIEDNTQFAKNLAILLNKNRLSDVLPTLFDDIQRRMDSWGKQGTMDPFKNVYDLVFQMTVRMASCHELASDLSALTKLQKDYWDLEKSATPTSLLLPWFPSPASRAKKASTTALFQTLWGYIEERKKASTPNSDAIDLLLGQGLSNEAIIQFVLGVIFAGVINTGINVCWILLYTSFHTKWKSAVQSEIRTIIAQHTNTTASEPLHKRLSTIPISVWEEQMPTLDLVIRETIRLVVNGTALRRNLPHGDRTSLMMPGVDREIPKGGFIGYSLADAHMDPEVYTDPEAFEPERFSPGREEDKRAKYGFLGWGAGRHPCLGMRVAKLEIKIVVALFVAGYEYDLVDSKGRFPESPPIPDYNNILQTKPKGEPCFINFKRIVE